MRFYRFLLLVFPAEFRRRFGDDMTAAFADRWRAARTSGWTGRGLILARNFADTIVHGLAERRADRATRRRNAGMWSTVKQDVVFGFRSFIRRPGFTAAVVATLALGIGANIAVFSVMRTVLLPDLLYPDPDRLANVYLVRGTDSSGQVTSPGAFGTWQRGSAATFDALAAYDNEDVSIVAPAGPILASAAVASPAIFDVMGLAPMLGRPLIASDAVHDSRVAVLTHALWMNAFGGDPDIVNGTVRIDGEPWTVVGVMPAGAALPNDRAQLWMPLTLSASDLSTFGRRHLSAMGRLRPGVTPERASEELSRAQAQFGDPERTDEFARVAAMREDEMQRIRPALLLLQGVTIAVLLIACVNVANLLLAASTARARELAVRRALGASGWRITRQLFTEDVLLAGAGALAGVGLAAWLAPSLVAAYPPGLPLSQQPSIGWFEIGVAIALCAMAVLVFGAAPVFASHRAGTRVALNGGRQTPGRKDRLVRTALVTAEVALALLLLTGGGLLIRSYLTLTNQPLGFEPSGVLTARISLPESTYPTADSRARFIQTLTERMAARPGVGAAAVTTSMPFGGGFGGGGYTLDRGDGQTTSGGAMMQSASSGYQAAVGLELVQGRFLEPTDTGSNPAAIVNEALAAQIKGNVVGMRVRRTRQEPWATIVGVVRNTRTLFVVSPQPEIILSTAHAPPSRFQVMLRTAGDPLRLEGVLRESVRGLDPDLPVTAVSSLESRISDSVARQRFNMAALVLLAGIALALALLGIYGVTAYVVGLRTREVGIRMALGARPGQVRTLIVRQGLLPVFAGIALGLTGAWWSVGLLESELFEVAPHDPVTFVAAAGAFLVAGLVSNWLPAGRALTVDPATTLRTE